MDLSAVVSSALFPALLVALAIVGVALYLRSLASVPGAGTHGSAAGSIMPGAGPAPRYPGVVTASELAAAKGGPGANLYVAVTCPFDPPADGGTREVTVFDMGAGGGADFYGPAGPYAVFAGVDASRGLAKSSMDAADVAVGGVDGLSASEMDTLTGWYTKYQSKYPVAGRLVGDDYRPPEEEGGASSTADKKNA
ncbi:hypothetical protein MMPV_008417 [Pyropia vietnamensis]